MTACPYCHHELPDSHVIVVTSLTVRDVREEWTTNGKNIKTEHINYIVIEKRTAPRSKPTKESQAEQP